MSSSPRISSGFKLGAGVGLTLGILAIIGFGSLIGMLAILYLDVVAPSLLFFLETLFYSTLVSAVSFGSFTGGMLAKNAKDTWMSIGVGAAVGAIGGFFSFIGIVMSLGSVLGATGGTGGLVFVALAALTTLAATTGLSSLIGGMIAKGFSGAEVNDKPSFKEAQQPRVAPLSSSQLSSFVEASQLQPLQSSPDLDTVSQAPTQTFKLLESLRGTRKGGGKAEEQCGLEDGKDFLSTESTNAVFL